MDRCGRLSTQRAAEPAGIVGNLRSPATDHRCGSLNCFPHARQIRLWYGSFSSVSIRTVLVLLHPMQAITGKSTASNARADLSTGFSAFGGVAGCGDASTG